ncbi:MAG: hypothetical protein Q9227_000593 [Pyrenula ochraceoflavens]
MAQSASTAAQKRKRLPFSPPRAKNGKSTYRTNKAKPRTSTSNKPRGRPSGSATKARKSAAQSRTSTPASASIQSSSPPPSSPAASEPDFILAEVTAEDEKSTPPISHDLIQRIMHEAYREPARTMMSAAAKEIVGKYVEIFVREAIARCAFERQEKERGDVSDDIAEADGWLEVEDLEKCAPQLILDF